MIERNIQNIISIGPLEKRNAFIAEVTSTITESNKKTDIYFYRIKDNKLFSPTHGIFVEDSTFSQKDKKLINKIESWAVNNQEGFAVWISPPQERGEISLKITLMKIITLSNQKIIENKSTCVNPKTIKLDSLIEFLIACSIYPQEKIELGKIRDSLIILAKPSQALSLLGTFFEDGWKEQKQRIKKAVEIQKVLTQNKQTATDYLKQEIGIYPLSCPTMGEKIFTLNSIKETGARYLECTCPFCHLKVKARIENGRIYCPNCGGSADYFC